MDPEKEFDVIVSGEASQAAYIAAMKEHHMWEEYKDECLAGLCAISDMAEQYPNDMEFGKNVRILLDDMSVHVSDSPLYKVSAENEQ